MSFVKEIEHVKSKSVLATFLCPDGGSLANSFIQYGLSHGVLERFLGREPNLRQDLSTGR